MTTATNTAKTTDKATATKSAAKPATKTSATVDAKPVEKAEATSSAPEERKGVSAPVDNRTRVNYKPDKDTGLLEVSYGAQSLDFDTSTDVFANEDIKEHLAYMGLITYLQRESSRAREEKKLDVIDEAYTRLCEEGMQAFERKSNAPKGPKKADKIAALAMIKGRTPDAVRDAIKKLPQAKQDELLNHPKVLAKVEELQAGDTDDLSV